MMQSFVVDVAGTFVGAAILTHSLHGGRYRFIAVDPRVEDLDQSEWSSLEDVCRVAAHLLRTGRLPASAAPAPERVTPTRTS